MSEQNVTSNSAPSTSAQVRSSDFSPHDSDDEPMVYTKPRDYATWARGERDRRLAEGADPDSVILQSQVRSYIPRQEGETPMDYTKRYSETMNSMIRRGVTILNDMTTTNRVPDEFGLEDGRIFNLGPKSGATKGEYREFAEWWHRTTEDKSKEEVPEKFLKFETTGREDSEL